MIATLTNNLTDAVRAHVAAEDAHASALDAANAHRATLADTRRALLDGKASAADVAAAHAAHAAAHAKIPACDRARRATDAGACSAERRMGFALAFRAELDAAARAIGSAADGATVATVRAELDAAHVRLSALLSAVEG